jgi:hypothetical protein
LEFVVSLYHQNTIFNFRIAMHHLINHFQQDATTIMDIQMGSQQSLPDLPTTTMQMDTEYYNAGVGSQDQSNQLRPSKSLSGR